MHKSSGSGDNDCLVSSSLVLSSDGHQRNSKR
ncbi:unnamed protein product [Brugia timori]|uniref:Uncharacterized protein n=1 Tax=Brugia timori TaxID=42155 RepID=A0A3P7WQU7_9BILA|nr:unnamed protein product [Brugia timori]